MRVHLYQSAFIIYFFSQLLDLVVTFFVDLAIHFLSRALCHLSLLRSFSDNFVVSRYLIKNILLTLSFIIIIAYSYSTICHLR
jgi:hypothetical protein